MTDIPAEASGPIDEFLEHPETGTRRTRPLTRVTVNLTPRSEAALELAAETTQDSRTDTINRAIQVYSYLIHCESTGDTIWVHHLDESAERILSISLYLLSFQGFPAIIPA